MLPDHPWACHHRAVDVTDLLGLLGQYGSDGTYDTDGSGTVDVTDLLALLGEYGTPCNGGPLGLSHQDVLDATCGAGCTCDYVYP